MWTRKELKQQAKDALQRNYWKSVLVALILMALSGSSIGSLFSSASGGVNPVAVDENVITVEEGNSEQDSFAEEDADIIIPDMADMDARSIIISGIVTFIIFLIIFLFVISAALVFETLLGFPVIVGAARFMLKSVDGKADVKEVAYAFDHSYKNVVRTMFHTQLSIFLWSLLFIIPGIYKQYQYRMVEYIMAENPDMYYKDAMQLSKDMMDGEKWHAFVLDLSFVLWEVAGAITCGILYVMFVAPYQYLTNAALYRRLCTQKTETAVSLRST